MKLFASLLLAALALPAAVPVDLGRYDAGSAVQAAVEGDALTVRWPDESGGEWTAVFSLEPGRPLITRIAGPGGQVLEGTRPLYDVQTGIRRKSWNAFFDYPPSHPAGTRRFRGVFEPAAVRLISGKARLRIEVDGLDLGELSGAVAYTFFAGGRLIQQEALVEPHRDDLAYLYDAGLEFAAPADETPGRNMETRFAWIDTKGKPAGAVENGFQPERQPEKVRYRTLAAATAGGSIAAFPAPHQYFAPRDFTSNLAQLWRRAWRGKVSLGIRHPGDTDWQFYPWVNAPPNQTQHLSIFFLVSNESPEEAIEDVLAFTNRDRYPELDGFKTLSSHWHLAYTVQAMAQGFDWTPPFKPVLEAMGVDASIIMDFHGDGHPRDLTDLRLRELDAFFKACKSQSDSDFLLIPSEEANVHLGGHWAVVFPKPVYWFMDRPKGGAFEMDHPKFGKVYSTADPDEMLRLVEQQGGFMYQTHARTKGSTGYPDKDLDKAYFQSDRYLGAGWKAMPADLSSPRLGDRIFTLIDDLSQWGFDKEIFGEVDVFQFDAAHELYAHMNINYVRANRLPTFDNYDEILEPLVAGDFFTTTGEVLLGDWKIEAGDASLIRARADVRHTFPLAFAEVVWGDGETVHRKTIELDSTRQHGRRELNVEFTAPGWKWARLAVWDVAANGAFVNPVWRNPPSRR